MNNMLKNRTVGSYCGLTGAAVSIIGAILLAILDYGDATFTWLTFGLCLGGGIVGLGSLLTDFALLPFTSAILIAVGMSNHLANGAYSLMNIALGSTFYDGNEWMVIGFFAVFFTSFVLLTISCYTVPRRT